jgi:Flp pilus assembly protein TadG
MDENRRGGFMVLAAFCLVAGMGFVSLCVDVGYLSLAKQKMQNGVDAAALAAAMEITNAIQTAGPDVTDVTTYCMQQARLKAQSVAALNGIYVDPNRDVTFGRRTSTDNNGNFQTTWNTSPANVVKVTAHRDNADSGAPDAKLKLFFAGVLGSKTASLVTTAAAYVESRDIVCVLDFSGSMNDDSTYATLGERDRTALETNMQDIWNVFSQRNVGDLDFEPDWLTVTASSGTINGSTIFRNTAVDVTTSKNMSSVKLTFSDNSTQTITTSGTSGTFQRSGSTKTINSVAATVKYEDWGSVATGNGSNNGRTASVKFDNSNVTINSSSNMSSVKILYYPSGYDTVSKSGTTATATGDSGKYISQVQVKVGSYWVTVNNPNGSSPDIITQTLTFDDTVDNVKAFYNLNGTWPWSSGSWSSFVTYCRTEKEGGSPSQISNAGYLRKYGGKCLVNYLLTQQESFASCEDHWKAPCYPFHSLKQGVQLFADFLQNLKFDDEMGIVSYDTYTRPEQTLNYDGYTIDLTSNPISNQFANYKAIIGHKQAGHYYSTTNIGGGLKQGKLLLDASARPGSRPTILLMTDGLANVKDNNYTFPGNWDWNALFDYNSDGQADYSTSDSYARYALGMAKEAVDAGYTIHTLSVGMGADTELLRAIAFLGNGVYIQVPGDLTVAQMEAQVLEGFNKIAAYVPPAKLVSDVQ